LYIRAFFPIGAEKKNHAHVLVLRYLESWACELLTNRHRHPSVCSTLRTATLTHNIPTSEPRVGELPLASVYETFTISKPPYLKPQNA